MGIVGAGSAREGDLLRFPKLLLRRRARGRKVLTACACPTRGGLILPVLTRLDVARRVGKRPREEMGRARRVGAEGEGRASPYQGSGAPAPSPPQRRNGPGPHTQPPVRCAP